MHKILTPEERTELFSRHKNPVVSSKSKDRIKAILAYDDGHSYSEIAHILLIDDETVRRHIKNYLKSKKIKPANGGSKSKLNDDKSAQLIKHLEQKTYL